MLKTYVGYVRVSKEKQELSPNVQEEMIKDYCNRNNIVLSAIIKDIDYTGKNLNRPGIQSIINSKDVKGIVFAKLDRLTRSIKDLSNLLDNEFKDVELHSVNEKLETKTAGGRFFINIMVSVSSWERSVISERTKDVLQSKIKNGYHVGRIPYGKIIDNGKLIDCPNTGSIRHMIIDLRSKGCTYKYISDSLYSKGFSKDSKPFTLTLIERICKSKELA